MKLSLAQLFFCLILIIPGTNAHAATPSNVIPNACSPLGAQRIVVILANYAGAPADTATPNADYVKQLFLGSSDQDFSVADFYKTVSRGKAWLSSVTVLGPYQTAKPFQLDMSINAEEYRGLNQWESDLVNLASADFDFTNADRVVFITPNAIDLSGAPVSMAAGLSTQSVCDLDSVNVQGIHHPLAHSWVRASQVYLGATPARVSTDPSILSSMGTDAVNARLRALEMSDMAPIIHELGHTFGLGHANQVNRPQLNGMVNAFQNNEILPAADSTMYEMAYSDPFSVMGAGEIQWLNIAHLNQLGWLDANQLQEVRTEGTYRIYPLESDAGTLKGIKIPRVIQSPDESTVSDLWVEFRQRSTVYDTEINTGIVHSTAGAIVHYTNPKQPGPDSVWPYETVLLNFHPDGVPVNVYEPDYTLTTSWKDDHSMVQLDMVQMTSEYIDVHVSFKP